MALKDILSDIVDSLNSIDSASRGTITEFKRQKTTGAMMLLKGSITRLLAETKGDEKTFKIAEELSSKSPGEIRKYVDILAGIAAGEDKRVSLNPNSIPNDVRSEILADLTEIESCLKNSCYRSAIILCGRVMETALHRKYYEATGNDLLEKAPGIGLGSLIAKLAEKGVKLDPGLTNQIHLINQVRVYSVHTKQEAFIPGKTQAQAIVLYTVDILERLFR